MTIANAQMVGAPTGTTLNCAATTVGNTAIVVVLRASSSVGMTISDNASGGSNTWPVLVAIYSGSFTYYSILSNISKSFTQITISANDHNCILFSEDSGLLTSAQPDAEAAQFQSTTTTPTSPSATANGADLAYGFVSNAGGSFTGVGANSAWGTLMSGTGITNGGVINSGSDGLYGQRGVVAGAGAYTASFTTPSGGYDAVIILLSPAAGAGPLLMGQICT